MLQIDGQHLSITRLYEVYSKNEKIKLGDEGRERIAASRRFLEEMVAKSKSPIYGINTGFGSLYKVSISEEAIEQLQENLVLSHACGTGDEVQADIVRLMLLLKIHGLSLGYSGVSVELIERLIDMYNADVLPQIFELGSLGASGDLAPLAHLSLPLLGKGNVYHKGKLKPATEVLDKMGWAPLKLKSKEGLALLNGTQFMSAYGLYIVFEGHRMAYLSDAIATMSLEAFDGRPEPFDEALHWIRPHTGQIITAANVRELLEGSEIIKRKKSHVQDPYSFRCIPQVHGASKDALNYLRSTIETEINSVTDNPTLIADEGKIISGGNFHGQPLALALDFAAIALAELGSISERRTYQLISGLRGLPEFLVPEPGLNSGFMIPQYTAASIVSQNKQLCSPASVDSIVSSNGQEDHVSMGANAATKCKRVADNLLRILAIELMNAAQALEFRRPLKSSAIIEELHKEFREHVPFLEKDSYMSELMARAETFLYEMEVDEELIF